MVCAVFRMWVICVAIYVCIAPSIWIRTLVYDATIIFNLEGHVCFFRFDILINVNMIEVCYAAGTVGVAAFAFVADYIFSHTSTSHIYIDCSFFLVDFQHSVVCALWNITWTNCQVGDVDAGTHTHTNCVVMPTLFFFIYSWVLFKLISVRSEKRMAGLQRFGEDKTRARRSFWYYLSLAIENWMKYVDVRLLFSIYSYLYDACRVCVSEYALHSPYLWREENVLHVIQIYMKTNEFTYYTADR